MRLYRWFEASLSLLAGCLFATCVSGATLVVVKAGSAAGTVTSSTGPINCGVTCSHAYVNGTAVTLTATPAAGAQFTGWLGACSDTAECVLTLNADAAAIATFAPAAMGPPSLDIDANAQFDALTDGLLAIRYLFGLSGSPLTGGAIAPGAGRTASTSIADYLNDIRPILDVDGNGQADALSDGLLIIRYLFGLRGNTLIAGAIGQGAARLTAPAIEARIALLYVTGPVVARIEITPGALLLTQAGASGQLSAVAYDAQNGVINAPIGWSTNAASIVSVSPSGLAQAAVGAGVARITASSGGVASPPAYVTIAAPVAGAILLTDPQILSGPTPVDPNAAPHPDNQYTVVLQGVAAMPAGTILINAQGKVVGGRVVAAQQQGMNLLVTLEVVPPQEMFTVFEFKDTLEVNKLQFETPPEFLALYDVVQTGDSFVYTPKSGSLTAVPGRLSKSAQQVQASVPPIPPFGDCELTPNSMSTPLPLALSAQPLFALQVNGTLVNEVTSAGRKVVVSATPEFKINSVLEVTAAFEAKASCKLVLHKRKVRVPGWAGLFFGGDIEFGVGAEASGKVTLVSAKVGGSVTISGNIQAGIQCTSANGTCALTGSATATTPVFTPTLTLPALNQAKFEPAVTLFGFIAAELGNADIEQLQFEALEAKVGPKLTATYMIEALQIDNPDPSDGRAKYSLSIEGEVGPGLKLGEFLQYTGLATFVPLKLTFSGSLGESPTGTATADRASYLPGNAATVTVTLDPANASFLLGTQYNIDKVVVARKDGPFTTQTLATVTATAGQTNFTIPFTSPGLIAASELFVFVVPKFLGFAFLPRLEVAQVVGQGVIQAAGGTFRNAAAGTIGTAIMIRLQNPDTTLLTNPVNVSIQGPAGWNGDQPLTISYPAGLVRQFYTVAPAPVTGSYMANVTVAGLPSSAAFNVNASVVLDAPANVAADLTTSGVIGSSWNAVSGATSYLTRVFDVPNSKILSPVAFTTSTSASLQGVPIVGSGSKALQVYAFSNDMTPTSPPIPATFDVSFHRMFLSASVVVSPATTSVAPNSTVNLNATVNGLPDTSVTWIDATPTGGNSAQFTAPATPGTYSATATSVANSSFKAHSTITVTGASTCTAAKLAQRFAGTWQVSGYSYAGSNCAHGDYANFLNGGTMTIVPNGFTATVTLSNNLQGYSGELLCAAGGYFFSSNIEGNLTIGMVDAEPNTFGAQAILYSAAHPRLLACGASLEGVR